MRIEHNESCALILPCVRLQLETRRPSVQLAMRRIARLQPHTMASSRMRRFVSTERQVAAGPGNAMQCRLNDNSVAM